ncbi:MAG: SRPBCC family protein [Solirubrobacteraceae bacterium]
MFPYLSDPHNQREWTPNFLALEVEPDGPTRLGTRYRGKLRLFGSVNFVVDRYEPGRLFRVDTDPPAGRLTHEFSVDQHGDGSLMKHVVELAPTGAARVAAPVTRLLIRLMVAALDRQMTKVLNALPRR